MRPRLVALAAGVALAASASIAAADDDYTSVVFRVGGTLEFYGFGDELPPAGLGGTIAAAGWMGLEIDAIKLFGLFYPELDLELTNYDGAVFGGSSQLRTIGGALLLKHGEGADQVYLQFGIGTFDYTSLLAVPPNTERDREGSGLYLRYRIGFDAQASTILNVRIYADYVTGLSGSKGRAWHLFAVGFAIGLSFPA